MGNEVYITCSRRKGQPKVHIKVCKFCEDRRCKQRKNLPFARISKFCKERGKDGK